MKTKIRLPKTLTTVTLLSKLLALLLILAFIFAGALAGRLYQHAVDVAAFSTYLSALGRQNDVGPMRVITLGDNGKTIQVHVGDMVSFELSSLTERWSLSFSAPLLKQVPLGAGIAQRVGQEGKYLVTKAGTVTVIGAGVANCTAGTMCPMYVQHFSVTIVASK